MANPNQIPNARVPFLQADGSLSLPWRLWAQGLTSSAGGTGEVTAAEFAALEALVVANQTAISTANAVARAGGATSTKLVSAPTAANSTASGTMQGLAGAITPIRTGKVLVSISGTITSTSTTAGTGLLVQGSYGAGAAPTNNAALAGTQVGAVQAFSLTNTAAAAGDVQWGFNVQYLITGLTLGTTYWLDLAAQALGSVSVNPMVGVVITAAEL